MSKGPLSFKEERVIFYAQLGLAIGRWARVEANLFQFMNWSFLTNEQAKLSIAYLSIENFRSKLQVVDRLVTDAFGKHKEFGEWQALHKRLVSMSKVRNQLAHNQVISYGKGNPGRRMAVAPALDVLVPFFRAIETQTELNIAPPAGSLFIRDIAQQRLLLDALRLDMAVVHARLLGHSAPKQEYPAPVGRLPTIAQMRKVIRDRFSPPPKSSGELPWGAYE